MTAPVVPDVADLTAVVEALFDDKPASLGFYTSDVDTSPAADSHGRVKGYVVFYPSPGLSQTSALAARPGQLLWGFHMSAAGGTVDYALFALAEIRKRIDFQTLTVAGITVGRMQPPLGAIPPPIAPARNIEPTRYAAVLEYQVLTVTNP